MKKLILSLALSLPLLASQAQAGAIANVAEASNYTLAYALAVPTFGNFGGGPVQYTIDNHANIADGSFSRIAYYLELQNAGGQLMYAYVSMDAFTTSAAKIGVPTGASGEFYQQNVNNMNVVSNVRGVTTGTGIATGSLEFWNSNYGTNSAPAAPAANDFTYDYGDTPDGGGIYGSMQINNYGAKETIIAYNDFNNSGVNAADIGIGNNPGEHPDYTFARNANLYTIKNIEVLVLNNAVPEPGSLALLGLGLLGAAVARRKRVK